MIVEYFLTACKIFLSKKTERGERLVFSGFIEIDQ